MWNLLMLNRLHYLLDYVSNWSYLKFTLYKLNNTWYKDVTMSCFVQSCEGDNTMWYEVWHEVWSKSYDGITRGSRGIPNFTTGRQ